MIGIIVQIFPYAGSEVNSPMSPFALNTFLKSNRNWEFRAFL